MQFGHVPMLSMPLLPWADESFASPEEAAVAVADDDTQSVLVFLRIGMDPERPALVACNFTPVPRHDYRVGVTLPGFWREVVNTDASVYGGSNVGNRGGIHAEGVAAHGRPHSLVLTLPPLATVIFECLPG